ncbi:DUF6049 family protein [Prauserella muralis]|uniref:Uncharacterized protein n=1 Tax=Prauserella muralis TaxID=588067 RepID=A0A2V4B8G7_9PSEU|nr:DUF6049 family protein [Prauserella muralis]PXY31654.1 hypothetical protein BAY60_04640 [Prauserella muralis]TWE13972.1 hypothetical protein FHX69_6106 [Prauserella muralis]
MTRGGAFVLALVFLLAQGLFGGPVSAQTIEPPPERLHLEVQQLAPRMVTPADDQVTVTATITNVGDRRVSDVVARLQVGAPLTTEDELAQSVTEAPPADAGASEWVGITGELQPRQRKSFTLTVPAAELGLSSPGVYPLLVNVNGTPDYGGAARLAELNLLMPVLDPPSEAGPAPLSMLWPIAGARPRVVGTTDEGRVVLSDDALADELRPGGRLDALVAAAAARRDSPLFGSLCFAVDPDLLDTVAAMREGYQVETPGGRVDGTGREHAKRWLDSLKSLVAGHCVIQIPYADADLTALSRVRSGTDLVRHALNGASILSTLDVQQRPGVLWPGSSLDTAALRRAADAGARTIVADPTQLESGEEGLAGPTTVDGTGVTVVPYDPAVAAAFAGDRGRGTSATAPADQPNVATQNGIAAIAFRAGLGEGEPGGTVLAAPPHAWDAPVGEFGALLDSLGAMVAAGMLQPTPLEQVLAAPQAGSATLAAGEEAVESTSGISSGVIAELSAVEHTAADLRGAMSVDATRQVQPVSVIQPLHNAVVRATSTTWRGPRARQAAAADATHQADALRGRVTVATPSQPISLASGSSPLPVTLTNTLPVAVTVRIRLENFAGLRPARVPDTVLAANSSVPRLIPAEALRSGRFSIDVSLVTPGGTRLGSPARLELTSNEFGVVTVVLTATAAGALVLLSARRIYQRVSRRKADRS